MTQIIQISFQQLLLCVIFVFIAGVASLVMKLKLERDLLWATTRTFAQLYLVGYVLKFVFQMSNVYLIFAVYVWMVFWAANAIKSRLEEKRIPVFMPVFVSMTITYMVIGYIVTSLIITAQPWYTPQYFIPIVGMIIGNSMNAISLALERLLSGLSRGRNEVELKLCLGASYHEASQELVRDSVRVGMIPSINSAMTVGLVFLPGMMTGQILAGAAPMTAIKYQIVVMLMLLASAAVGCTVITYCIRRRCFSKMHALRF